MDLFQWNWERCTVVIACAQQGDTALHGAVYNNHLTVTSTLLQCHCDVNIFNKVRSAVTPSPCLNFLCLLRTTRATRSHAIGRQLASWLINAQLFLAHRSAADDNSLIGCTSHDLTDDWSLASTHFVDSQYAFLRSFGCVLLLNQMFWKQCAVRRCHSDLSYQSVLEIRVRNLGWTQSCTVLAFFTENKESEHLIFREFHGR